MQYGELKKLIVVITGFVLLLVVFIVFMQYRNSFSKINVQLTNTSSVSLYKINDQSAELPDTTEYKDKTPDLTITNNGVYKISKGLYAYFTQPINTDFEAQSGIINTAEDKELLINPSLTNSKLDAIYATEKNNILSTLLSTYPNQMQNYTLEYGRVYVDGNWFGGYLVPKDGSDKLQVVLRKSNNTWEIAAKPNITISSAQYPDIPIEVTEAINIRPF